MMRLPSTGWEKMSTFLEIYLICIINACSYGFLVACEHLWHAWNALVRLFQRIYQAPYPPLPRAGPYRRLEGDGRSFGGCILSDDAVLTVHQNRRLQGDSH